MAGAAGGVRDRVLTVPNALSVLRLVLVPVFLYLLLVAHATGWAVGVLMFSGFSDWADGKIARLVANQSSRLGELLDPAVDRIYMVTVPVALAIYGAVPWWIVLTLIGRDLVLAATLPVLRSRGLTALPVTYVGKAATFALMSGFPLVLLGQFDGLWSRVVLACGWAFLIWGMAMYLWSGVLYLIQVAMVVRRLPKVSGATSARAKGGHSPRMGPRASRGVGAHPPEGQEDRQR
jgi:cardiolipin synthase